MADRGYSRPDILGESLVPLLGVRVLFHHIPNSRAELLLDVLRKSYPDGQLLELYSDRAPVVDAPSADAFTQFFAGLEPEVWEKVRCLAGPTVQFALAALPGESRAITMLRDPIERVTELFEQLKAGQFRPGMSAAAELIRARDWSLLDIYENYGGQVLSGDREGQSFADFFNGQARAILAPHFPVDWMPFISAEPGQETTVSAALNQLISEHYLLGSATRYSPSIRRFADEFGWPSVVDAGVDVAAGHEGEQTTLSDEVVETILAHNRLDHDLHSAVLSELADADASSPADDLVPPQPLSIPSTPEELASPLAEERAKLSRALGALTVRERRLGELSEKLEERERALAEVRRRCRELETRVGERDREHTRSRDELCRLLDAGRALAAQLNPRTTAAESGRSEGGVPLLEVTLDRAGRALASAAEEQAALTQRLERRTQQLEAAFERERTLLSSVQRLEDDLARARTEAQSGAEAVEWLSDERSIMFKHAQGLAQSRAWRYGHNVSKLVNWLTFRRSVKPTGAAEILLSMLQTRPQLGRGTDASDNNRPGVHLDD